MKSRDSPNGAFHQSETYGPIKQIPATRNFAVPSDFKTL